MRGYCEKNFPRKLTSVTDASVEGYPHYRRRETITESSKFEMPQKTKINSKPRVHCVITNKFLSGYNPAPCLRYRYHQNVESTAGHSSIAYTLNYIHKGSDVGYIEFKEFSKTTKNEITLHKFGRVMTADEAHWNLSGFKCSNIEPTVHIMPYMTPENETVACEVGVIPNAKQKEELVMKKKFNQFFIQNEKELKIFEKYEKLCENKVDPEDICDQINFDLGYLMFHVENGILKRCLDYEKEETNDQKLKRELENLPPPELPWSFELTYLEFGKRYRWIGTNKVWKRYKELTDCGTMMKMSWPGYDAFYLRILLKFRKGMSSCKDLYKGPNNVIYPNFKLAALAWGYIADSSFYFETMHEANLLGFFGTKLLAFFAGIIKEGDATNLRELWDGKGLEKKDAEKLIDEEKMYPHGMRHLMITVPHKMTKKYPKNWSSIKSKVVKDEIEQITLKKLNRMLEDEGVEYPPELPSLTEENKHALTEEYIHAHKCDPNEAEEIYNHRIASNRISTLF